MAILRTSNLPAGRQMGVDAAAKGGFTHILFLDDDMKFTPKAFDILLKRDLDFVGANCMRRDGIGTTATDLDDKMIYSAGKTGIQKISVMGLGFTLIKTSVFEKIPRPCFSITWKVKDNELISVTEDHYLCGLLLNSGIDMYVDHDAARYVIHMGDQGYQENFKKA